MAARRHWLSALAMLALGGSVLPLGCMTASGSSEEGDNDAAESERVGESEQAFTCGCGGPHAGCRCLGRCGAHDHWTDLGVPEWGQCHQMVDDYCQNRGGNRGACWGWL